MRALVYAALIGLVSASQLKVVHPVELQSYFHSVDPDSNERVEGLIPSSLGNFGHFAYGSTVKGRVHYPIDNIDGCSPFKDEHFNA